MSFECVECLSEVEQVDEAGRCVTCRPANDISEVEQMFSPPRVQRSEPAVVGDQPAGEGGAFRNQRLSRGLTQEQLAQELGVSVRTISRWETGESKPSKMALKILKMEGL